MNIQVIWPKKADVFRREVCVECSAPINHAARGRPRKFCSDACRQRRHRTMRNFRSKAYQYRKVNRAAERVLRKHERAKGKRIDDIEPIFYGYFIDRRNHLRYGLQEGQALEYCLWCGTPILRESFGLGARRRCCSKPCRVKLAAFVRQMKIAVEQYEDSLDPEVIRRLRLYQLKSKRILPPTRTMVWICAHCNKPFAATHPARKYCDKKCRQNAWYAAHKTCEFCKRRYRPAYKARAQMYCSEYCRVRGTRRKPPLAIPRSCLACGAPFVANRQHANKVYCSKRCHVNAAARRQRARKKQQMKQQKAR